jgi:Fur family transcriptional regulator, zinc uptake regulator
MSTSKPNLAFRAHNHANCIDSAITRAKRLCEERAVRLTPLREQVLQLVWQSHKPLGAYAILDLLAEQPAEKKRRQAPPTVYRALEFLLEHGLVHRINSLNAFIGCSQPHSQHHSHFLICQQCKSTVEVVDTTLDKAIHTLAQEAQFVEESTFVEITGYCSACRRKAQ